MSDYSFKFRYPPTVNSYWRSKISFRRGKPFAQYYVSAEGKKYQEHVASVVGSFDTIECDASIMIQVTHPDRKQRDLDNVLKALLDSLENAGVVKNDSQFSRILVERAGVAKPGFVQILIETC